MCPTGVGSRDATLLIAARRFLEWNGIDEFLEKIAHNVTLAILGGQLQERDDDSDAVQPLQQAVVAANAAARRGLKRDI